MNFWPNCHGAHGEGEEGQEGFSEEVLFKQTLTEGREEARQKEEPMARPR